MRLSSTSFTNASTAVFGVAVVGYAAVRLVSYAAPHIPGHLHHAHTQLAAPQVRQIQTIRDTAESASRSEHRSAQPTRLALKVRHAVAVAVHHQDWRHLPTATTPTTAALWSGETDGDRSAWRGRVTPTPTTPPTASREDGRQASTPRSTPTSTPTPTPTSSSTPTDSTPADGIPTDSSTAEPEDD